MFLTDFYYVFVSYTDDPTNICFKLPLCLNEGLVCLCVLNRRRAKWNLSVKSFCYTSQLKYVFRLEENVSRAMGQNSLTP